MKRTDSACNLLHRTCSGCLQSRGRCPRRPAPRLT